MIKYIFNFLLILFITIKGYSQYASDYQTHVSYNAGSRQINTAFGPAPKDRHGSLYLYEDWIPGTVLLKDSTQYTDLRIKLDYRYKSLEFLDQRDTRVIPFSEIRAVSLQKPVETEIYINGDVLEGKHSPYRNQLIEVLVNSEVGLYSVTKIHLVAVQPSTGMNRTVDGNQDQITMTHHFMITFKHEIITITRKSQLKKDIIRLFGEKAEPLLKGVSTKDEGKLKDLVHKLNNMLNHS